MATYFKEITEEEIANNSVKKLANRPSSPSRYGESRLTAEEVKEAFDRLPRLIAQRYNTLISQIRQFGGDEIITTAYDGNRKSLNEIFRELESGLFANALKFTTGESLSVFYEKMRRKVIVTSGEPTEYTVGQIGTILVAIPDVPDDQPVETVKLYVCTKARENRTYEWALVAGGGSGDGIASIEQTKVSTEDGGENIITIFLKSGEAIPFTVYNGNKGKDGTSVSITNIIESTESGGTNVVEFSDNNRLEIKNGNNGNEGVGVESVVQTTTNTESGGINVITVKLTNGSKHSFEFRNGKQGGKGDKGDTGEGFKISKVYASIASMNVGYNTDGVPIGGFVLINTNNPDDPDNAKLYVKGNAAYTYLTDLSGSQGIQGVGIASIEQTTTSNEDDGHNIITATRTDGSVSTFVIKNGRQGNPGKDGKDGAAGVGISKVEQTTTSTADGGNNVVTVTLTNGNTSTFTVKNGSKGKDGGTGAAGADGVTFVPSITDNVLSWTNNGGLANPPSTYVKGEKGDTPPIAQTPGQSESLVMSQKAVTDLVADALESATSTQYETVDSVDQMTDTNKSYVLSSTGTIWSYRTETSTKVVPNFTNLIKFDTSGNLTNVALNQRYSGSAGVSAGYLSAETGSFAIADTIKVGGKSVTLRISKRPAKQSKLAFFKEDGVEMHSNGVTTVNSGDWQTDEISGYKYVISGKDAPLVKISVAMVTSAITASDLKDLIFTANEPITYTEKEETISEWYDTGLTPSSSGSGGNYVGLLVKVNENKSAIAELDSRVIALESGSDSLTVPSFWKASVDECISKIKALQIGINCVTFPFFSDNHQRNGYAGMLIAKVMKECNIPYCFFGGDSISSGYIESEAKMIEQDRAFDEMMSYIPNGKFCRAVGNHDGYWAVSSTEKHFYSRDQVYDLFLREESLAQNKHFGDDGTYYYIDDIASKVRFIVLNTNSDVISAGNERIDSTQLSWLQNTALSINESGWGVVIISHCPISNNYHANVINAEEVISVVNASNVDIIGWYSGHIHRDRMFTHLTKNGTDGVEGDPYSPLGFTQITITSDHTSIAYDDATKHTVANDDQSHAIDFVTINKNTRTVNLTRLGIGNDREYTY